MKRVFVSVAGGKFNAQWSDFPTILQGGHVKKRVSLGRRGDMSQKNAIHI
jgi:hypothetical protein